MRSGPVLEVAALAPLALSSCSLGDGAAWSRRTSDVVGDEAQRNATELLLMMT
jgi:hypothetical protein